MSIARSIFVSIVAVGLVVTLSRTSLGHGEGHGGGHHEEHHGEHHEGHHEEHHGEHHEAHHEEHHDEHHGEHHDAHHENHHDEHPYDHHDDHHDWNHDDHHDWHHDDHHAYDHHRFDHRDWYRHAWWNHQPSWHGEAWHHWWHRPTVNECVGWSSGCGLGDPIYYDYGPNGNVVYRDANVYVNGQLVGTTDAYAKSATALADVGGTANTADDKAEDWLPFGTFAVLRKDADAKPSQTIQLAMNKDGNISGVLFDLTKDTSTPIHGSLDRKTQRVAFGLGDNLGLVAETSYYNLTKNEVPLLVHSGSGKPEIYTLIRFEHPPTDTEAKAKEADVGMLLR